MITGCMSQAKKVLEYYDEILDGPSPEELVESTHEEIAKLLGSREALSLFAIPDVDGENKQQERY